MSSTEFETHLREVHRPLAMKLLHLRKYIQNFPVADPKRKSPPWDAIVELYWDDWESMEAAWASPEGAASDADLPLFVDMKLTSWSVVLEFDGLNGAR